MLCRSTTRLLRIQDAQPPHCAVDRAHTKIPSLWHHHLGSSQSDRKQQYYTRSALNRNAHILIRRAVASKPCYS